MKYLVLGGFVLLLFVRPAAAQTERATNPAQPQGQLGWVQVPIGTSNPINSLSFPTKDTAFAWSGPSLRSVDGGLSWQPFSLPVSNVFHFVDGQNGYTAGYTTHTAYHTSDGGGTWTSADDHLQLVQVVLAISKDSAFVTGDGDFSRTTDAGKTWQTANPRVVALALAFADSKHGVAVGEQEFGPMAGQYGGGCATTNDGGATWVQQYTGAHDDLHGVAMMNNDTIIAVGGQGYVTRSTNGGISWDSIPLVSPGFLTIAHGRSRLLAASGSVIWTSLDAGLTWQREESGISGGLLTSIAMFDDNFALASGANGVILRTTDGGTDWVQVSPPSPEQLSIGIYPEPETPTMDIFYVLPQLQDVTITVYDVLGKVVAHLLDRKLQPAGRHSVQIKGGSLPVGSYIVRIQTERFSGTGKFEIVR